MEEPCESKWVGVVIACYYLCRDVPIEVDKNEQGQAGDSEKSRNHNRRQADRVWGEESVKKTLP